MATTQKTTPIQWVSLIFLAAFAGFLAYQGSHAKEGFGAYSPAIMLDLAAIGVIVRSIFKATEDDQ